MCMGFPFILSLCSPLRDPMRGHCEFAAYTARCLRYGAIASIVIARFLLWVKRQMLQNAQHSRSEIVGELVPGLIRLGTNSSYNFEVSTRPLLISIPLLSNFIILWADQPRNKVSRRRSIAILAPVVLQRDAMALQAKWTQAPEGRLPPKEQAKLWALREVLRKQGEDDNRLRKWGARHWTATLTSPRKGRKKNKHTRRISQSTAQCPTRMAMSQLGGPGRAVTRKIKKSSLVFLLR